MFLDLEASLRKAEALIEKAGAEGARLVVFPEAFLPAWPAWVDEVLPGEDAAWHVRLLEQSVVVPGPVTERLGAAARDAGVQLVMGVDEREEHGSTIYNTPSTSTPTVGCSASTASWCRPTPSGWWGMGDGSDLRVHQTAVGRVGGLICWENYMPLARRAYSGVIICVAPTLPPTSPVATMATSPGKASATIGVAPAARFSERSTAARADRLWRGAEPHGDWMLDGYSVIVDPTGTVLAGPLVREEGILYAELDLDAARARRRLFDPVGHYNRPDVFRLVVDDRPKPHLVSLAQAEPEVREE